MHAIHTLAHVHPVVDISLFFLPCFPLFLSPFSPFLPSLILALPVAYLKCIGSVLITFGKVLYLLPLL